MTNDHHSNSRQPQGGKDRGGGAQRLLPLQGLGPGAGLAATQETRASGSSKKVHLIRGKLEEIEVMRKALVAKKEALNDESYPAGTVHSRCTHGTNTNALCHDKALHDTPSHTLLTTHSHITKHPLTNHSLITPPYNTPFHNIPPLPCPPSRLQHPPSLLLILPTSLGQSQERYHQQRQQ